MNRTHDVYDAEIRQANDEIDRLRAELAEYRHDSYRCAHLTRAEKAEAAIARAIAVNDDPSVPLEALGAEMLWALTRPVDGAE